MKHRTLLLSALGLGLALSLPARAEDAAKAHKPVPPVGGEALISVTVSIEAINLETRELTLKGPLGNVDTVVVSPEVKRLNEFKVGDHIQIDYYAGIAAEVRPATEEEKAMPMAVLEDKGRRVEGAPAAGGYRVMKAVVTVEGLDRTTSSATLKGPRGNIASVKIQDPAVLASLHIGDSVVIVYAEALAVQIVKAPAPAAPTNAKAKVN
jgi:hypothetical protein